LDERGARRDLALLGKRRDLGEFLVGDRLEQLDGPQAFGIHCGDPIRPDRSGATRCRAPPRGALGPPVSVPRPCRCPTCSAPCSPPPGPRATRAHPRGGGGSPPSALPTWAATRWAP